MSNNNISTQENRDLRVCIDQTNDYNSAVIAVLVKTGSRNETKEESGISHFLEHMAFKGTKNLTAKQISDRIEDIGGYMNAFTSKEKTCYYVKVLKEDVEIAIDILSDILTNSSFSEEEIDKERGVIIQELYAGLDTPSDLVFDYHFYGMYGEDTPMGRTIIGTEENIKGFNRDNFVDYMSKNYSRNNTVISVCGNVDREKIVKMCFDKFANYGSNNQLNQSNKIEYFGNSTVKSKIDLEQAQCVLSFNAVSYHDEQYYTYQVMNNILGQGMSSRLFQEIREKMGLAYTVSSHMDCYQDGGNLMIYAGTSTDKIIPLYQTIINEILKLSDKIDDSELTRAINGYKASFLMSQESTKSRAMKLASNVSTFNRYITHEEMLGKINMITKNDVQNLAKDMFGKRSTYKPTFTIYGNIKDCDEMTEKVGKIVTN